MARKNKLTKFVKGVQVSSTTPARQRTAKPAGLYILELRSHVAGSGFPKKKPAIKLTLQEKEPPSK
jgi:hypothetical protein